MTQPGFEPRLPKKVPVSRDRRISAALLAGLGSVLVLSVLMLISGQLAHRTPGNGFLSGLHFGVSLALPFGILAMVWAGYRQMDEYGRGVHTRAATSGFVVAMLASTVGFIVEEQGYGRLPLWGVYMLGMLGYTVATIVIPRSKT